MAEPTINGRLNGKFALTILIPMLCSAIAGYGTFRFASGAQQQEILGLRNEVIELRKQVEKAATREELKIWMDTQAATLRDIQDNVRALRGK